MLLLEGDLQGSILMFPPLIPLLVFIGIGILYLFNKKWIGDRLLQKGGIIVLVIVMINYLFSLIL